MNVFYILDISRPKKITISHVRMLNIETKICLDQYIYEVTEKSSKAIFKSVYSTMVQVLIRIVQSEPRTFSKVRARGIFLS